ncbi:unnamed protein product [Prorocentrum cordatum]|uniref:Uncharacterized protein n=1 Tax=Prorocentrum cordatum TaxID=2364126 RepID=A0ABN9PVJ3_9DINO|nr:unnamed protein product [Polarella glacialis]
MRLSILPRTGDLGGRLVVRNTFLHFQEQESRKTCAADCCAPRRRRQRCCPRHPGCSAANRRRPRGPSLAPP